MSNLKLSRVIIINFITALIITLVGCYFLFTFNLTGVMFIANLFGIYFLVVYGLDILVDSGYIPNNYQRFIFAILFIVVFDILFVLLIPLLFGANVLNVSDSFTMIFNGARFDLVLDTPFYLAVFAVLMLIFNFLYYRKDMKN